jgi:hypothetical protein
MADKDQLHVISASFSSVTDAEKALDTIEQLFKSGAVGTLDAAVIDKENGKPHVVKRLDQPRIRVIPEWFGGGALPRKELHEAAEKLTGDQAGLLVVSGEPVAEEALDKALAGAGQVAKHKVEPRSTRSPASSRRRSSADRVGRLRPGIWWYERAHECLADRGVGDLGSKRRSWSTTPSTRRACTSLRCPLAQPSIE